jgi:hypothetical protein
MLLTGMAVVVLLSPSGLPIFQFAHQLFVKMEADSGYVLFDCFEKELLKPNL